MTAHRLKLCALSMHVFERITLVNLIGKYTKNTKNARNSFAEAGPIRSYNPGSSKINTVNTLRT